MTTTPSTPTVLRPGGSAYDERRIGFQTHRAHRPAGVVVAGSADDVVAAVRLAADQGRRVAVQATGHGVGATDPEALLVDTSGLTGVRIDPDARTARIAAGTRWQAVVDAAGSQGLAPLNGSAPGVGAVGYLLAGGLPVLGRSRGWAAAGVRSWEVVTADGSTRTVTPDDDLGWALAGGGGSFAVVTAVTVDLVALDTVYAGSLFLPFDDRAPDVLAAWRDWARDLPEATSTSVAVVPFPDVDGPPPMLRGRTAIAVRVAHDGAVADGPGVVAPLRELGSSIVSGPILDDVRARPWTDSAAIHRDPPGPAGSSGTSVGLGDLTDADLAALLTSFEPDRKPGAARRVVEVRRLGGALAALVDLPVRHDVAWTAGTVSVHTPGTDTAGIARAADRDAVLRGALAERTVGRMPMFLGAAGADPDAVRAAYRPDDWTRLRTVKAAVDPDDRILAAAPIPPA